MNHESHDKKQLNKSIQYNTVNQSFVITNHFHRRKKRTISQYSPSNPHTWFTKIIQYIVTFQTDKKIRVQKNYVQTPQENVQTKNIWNKMKQIISNIQQNVPLWSLQNQGACSCCRRKRRWAPGTALPPEAARIAARPGVLVSKNGDAKTRRLVDQQGNINEIKKNMKKFSSETLTFKIDVI